MSREPPLPPYLQRVLADFAGSKSSDVLARLRDPNVCMAPTALNAIKSTRLSFARVLGRRMIDERWRIERPQFQCDHAGFGHAVYAITAGRHRITYVARSYVWDGVEKVGRRSDGALRDMFGALFMGAPDENRIAAELATFDVRDVDHMRTDAMCTGWTPGSRSVRFFDHVVDALVAGRQPDPAVIGSGTGYLMRNGGYQGSGRNGSVSFEGFPTDHPFRHPFFADLFGLYMVRQCSIDMVNAIARNRNPNAAQLSPDMARYVGIGNSSGQGMCVALQRWPHWVATWMTVRELSLAYAKSMPVAERGERMAALLDRAASYYGSIELQCEDYVVPHPVLVRNLRVLRSWVLEAMRTRDARWGDLAARAQGVVDPECLEQFNALMIEIYPEFADATAGYLPIGAERERDIRPEATVGQMRDLLRRRYDWALRTDLTHSSARQHFWYHSADNGEQRRGERIIDPHEQFESFIDHIGLMQRLAASLTSYEDETPVAELVADQPDLFYAVSRAQYLEPLPYAEIRGNLIHRDFIPAHLIRFFLSVLGIECTNPLSIRYVRGVFFQGMPLPDELARGADPDWIFPLQPQTAPQAKIA